MKNLQPAATEVKLLTNQETRSDGFVSTARFKALRASRSAGGRLFFGFVIYISARSLLTSCR